jgi:hypothetical protein
MRMRTHWVGGRRAQKNDDDDDVELLMELRRMVE